jgi:hypothetical protein
MERMFVARRNGWTIEGFARSGSDEFMCRVSREHRVFEFASAVEGIEFADSGSE